MPILVNGEQGLSMLSSALTPMLLSVKTFNFVANESETLVHWNTSVYLATIIISLFLMSCESFSPSWCLLVDLHQSV